MVMMIKIVEELTFCNEGTCSTSVITVANEEAFGLVCLFLIYLQAIRYKKIAQMSTCI
jgi:hypothetical protein